MLIYGFAKLNGSQFTILDSELDKPMGQVSGFWLTWYYFGYSPFYGNFIALVQIAGALLLTIRRTSLLGASILAPVLANIVLIDVFYRIALDATLVAIGLLAAMLAIIAPHTPALRAALLPDQLPSTLSMPAAAKWSIRIAMLTVACGFTYWVANYTNLAPTVLDGTWDVRQVKPESATNQVPATVFFEYNRAFMVVFKARDGSYATHHFEISPDRHLGIWDRWLSKGHQLFAGDFTLSADSLHIAGNLESVGPVQLSLTRRPQR